MGMFDSFHFEKDDEQHEAQLKCGVCACFHFEIGDEVKNYGFDDGVYYDHDMVVVIYDGRFVGGFFINEVRDKRGIPIPNKET